MFHLFCVEECHQRDIINLQGFIYQINDHTIFAVTREWNFNSN